MLRPFVLVVALLGVGGIAFAKQDAPNVSLLKAKPVTQGHVKFSFKQMDVAADGVFKQFKAHILFNPAAPQQTQANITIAIPSVDTQNKEADAMLKSPVWFADARCPQAQFESTQVKALGQNRFQTKGFLTIKGVKRPIDTVFNFNSKTRNLSGQFVINRVDYKVGEGEWADEDLINHEVIIRYQFVLPK